MIGIVVKGVRNFYYNAELRELVIQGDRVEASTGADPPAEAVLQTDKITGKKKKKAATKLQKKGKKCNTCTVCKEPGITKWGRCEECRAIAKLAQSPKAKRLQETITQAQEKKEESQEITADEFVRRCREDGMSSKQIEKEMKRRGY